jgi:hypothetical protein
VDLGGRITAIPVSFRRLFAGEQEFATHRVVLSRSFEPGEYTLRANVRTLQFRLIRGAAGDLRVDPDPGPLPQPPYLTIM